MQANNSNPVALVTGSSKRIGAVIAQHLHASGYNLVLHYRESKNDAELLMAELNNKRPQSAVIVQADLHNNNSVNLLAIETLKAWKKLDLLVNNASLFYPTLLSDATQADWDQLFNSNLRGPYFLIQALAEALKKARGCVVNIADIYADHPLKNHSIYCMAKAGNVMMTKSLALELAPDVRVNGIAPGAILWPENQTTNAKQIIDKIPLHKTGSPDEIAKLVLYLSNHSHYITGQIIKVDGGRSLAI